MAKKSRRARSSKSVKQTNIQQPGGQRREDMPAQAVEARPKAAASHEAQSVTEKAAVNFREEYRYVLTDLRSMGILAAIMFAVLVSLSFILPAIGL